GVVSRHPPDDPRVEGFGLVPSRWAVGGEPRVGSGEPCPPASVSSEPPGAPRGRGPAIGSPPPVERGRPDPGGDPAPSRPPGAPRGRGPALESPPPAERGRPDPNIQSTGAPGYNHLERRGEALEPGRQVEYPV